MSDYVVMFNDYVLVIQSSSVVYNSDNELLSSSVSVSSNLDSYLIVIDGVNYACTSTSVNGVTYSPGVPFVVSQEGKTVSISITENSQETVVPFESAVPLDLNSSAAPSAASAVPLDLNSSADPSAESDVNLISISDQLSNINNNLSSLNIAVILAILISITITFFRRG